MKGHTKRILFFSLLFGLFLLPACSGQGGQEGQEGSIELPQEIEPTPMPPQYEATGTFRVEGTRIVDPFGYEFIIKGTNVNGPHWPWGRETTQDAELIASVWGFNTVRVNCFPRLPYIENNLDLDAIVDAFTERGVVTQIEVHDYTGTYPGLNPEYPSMEELKAWWVDKAKRYKDNPYVWFNLMNEPGGGEPVPELWKSVHEELIQAIRAVGAENIIVLDGHHFGQEGGYKDGGSRSGILTYGPYFVEHYKNITFALHMYYEWTDGQRRLEEYLDRVLGEGLSIHIGEYGAGDEGSRSATAAMFNAAVPRNVGRIVWHWAGGDIFQLTQGTVTGGGFEIDRTDGSKPENLTWVGHLIWDDNHGNPAAERFELAIADLYPEQAVFRAGDTLRFVANVLNLGTVNFPEDQELTVSFSIAEQVHSTHTIKGPIPIGTSISVPSAEYKGIEENIKVQVVLSIPDALKDNYTISNHEIEKIFIGSEPKEDGHDLMLTSVSFNEEQVAFGQRVRARAVIENQGNAASPVLWNGVIFKVNGQFIPGGGRFGFIAPGESMTITSDEAWMVSIQGDLYLSAALKADPEDINPHNQDIFTYYPGQAANLILNPGFEQDMEGWSDWGRSSIDLASPYHGLKSLRISAGGQGGAGQLNLALRPETTYRFGAWGKVGQSGGYADVGIKYLLEDGTEPHHMLTFKNTEYVYQEVVFTTPKGFSNGTVFVWKAHVDSDFYIDNLELVEVQE